MPKRSKLYYQVHAPVQTESFEPYWTAIVIIVMTTFTVFGIQSLGFAFGKFGVEKVTSCFASSNQSAFNRFVECTQ